MSIDDKNDSIFKALAASSRRAMLDMLKDHPQTTGELCTRFPGLDRCTVMQHLGVLERAGVVLVRREGRERWNELNAVPIQRELERWLSGFQQASASQLLAFERHLQETAAEEKED